MTTIESFSVSLSNRMFVFLCNEISNTRDSGEDATLDVAHNSLNQMPDEVLFDSWDRWTQEADNHPCDGSHDRAAFDAEFDALLETWGQHYDLQFLLDASEHGLSTLLHPCGTCLLVKLTV